MCRANWPGFSHTSAAESGLSRNLAKVCAGGLKIRPRFSCDTLRISSKSAAAAPGPVAP